MRSEPWRTMAHVRQVLDKYGVVFFKRTGDHRLSYSYLPGKGGSKNSN